jgi:hypothetical protein
MGKSIEFWGRVIRTGERAVMAVIAAGSAAVFVLGLGGPLGWAAIAGLAGGAFRLYAAWLSRRLPQRALGFMAAGQLLAGLAAIAVSAPVAVWAAYLLLSLRMGTADLVWGWLLGNSGVLLLAASAWRAGQWAQVRRRRRLHGRAGAPPDRLTAEGKRPLGRPDDVRTARRPDHEAR